MCRNAHPRPPKHYSPRGKPSSQPNHRRPSQSQTFTKNKNLGFALGGSSGPKGPVIDLPIFGAQVLKGLRASSREGLGGPAAPSRAGSGGAPPVHLQVVKGWGGPNPSPFGGRPKSEGLPPTLVHLDNPCPFGGLGGGGQPLSICKS